MGGALQGMMGKKILGVFFSTAIWLPHGHFCGQLLSPDVNHCVLHF